jgi:hypothetical protein
MSPRAAEDMKGYNVRSTCYLDLNIDNLDKEA